MINVEIQIQIVLKKVIIYNENKYIIFMELAKSMSNTKFYSHDCFDYDLLQFELQFHYMYILYTSLLFI